MPLNDCLRIIKESTGRELTDDEILAFHDRLKSEVSRIRAEDALASLDKSPEALVRQAAKDAAAKLIEDAQLKKIRTALTILAHDRNTKAMQAHPMGMMNGLYSLMVRDIRDQGSTLPAEVREKAIQKQAIGQMLETLHATDPKFFGLVEDKAGVYRLMKEMFGESTGDQTAAAGARAWLDTAEALRQRFNAAGGNVGKLDDWAIPQSHSAERVRVAGREQWVSDILPKLKREKYTKEDGTLMNDAELADFLGHAWETISSGGLNKLEPGSGMGQGMLANRGSEHRQIHFKDADSYHDYWVNYGDKAFFPTLVGHVSGMARDIALVETFGPNPSLQFRTLHDMARQSGAAEPLLLKAQSLYDELSGVTNHAEHETFARYMQGIRNVLISAKLGSAMLSSVTDQGFLYLTGAINHIPATRLFREQLSNLNPARREDRALARRAGLGLDVLLSEIHRFGEDGLGSGYTGKLANLTMRASGLEAWTNANKRAFGVSMMATLGEQTRQGWNKADRRILDAYGIGERDLAVWQRATMEDWGNGHDAMLTPESIMRIPDADLADLGGSPNRIRREAATKLLGYILEETDAAVPTPGVLEKTLVKQGTRKGTAEGELLRSMFLFKSFPITVITKHWERAFSQPGTLDKLKYSGALLASTTILGALAVQLKDLANGKDPEDMTTPAFIGRAITQGGGLGIYGDFLMSDVNRFGNSLTSTIAGPVAGSVEDLLNLPVGNIHQAARGEETHAGAEAIRFVKGNTPMVNLWYTKAVLDHAFFHEMQEYLSPGYLSRMRQRAKREFDQEFWWAPGDGMPDRAPDFAAALGE